MGNISARPVPNPVYHGVSPVGIIKQFMTIYHRDDLTEPQFEHIVRQNMYFITMKFTRRMLDGRANDPTAYLEAFNRVYRNWMRAAYGNNFHRRKSHLPLTYVCVDYLDSRLSPKQDNVMHLPEPGMRGVYDRTKITRSRAPYNKGDPLHIHALMLLRPGYGQACREVVEDYARCAARERTGLVDMQSPYPDRSLIDLASYCSKGTHEIAVKTGKESWTVLPS